MSRILAWTEWLFNLLGALLLVVILIAVCAQVLMRYVFDNATMWSDPVASAALAWLTFVATAVAVRSDSNMYVRFTWGRLSPAGRAIAETVCQILTAAFAVVLSYSAWELMKVTDTSEVEGLPFFVSWAQMYSVTLIAGALIVLFATERSVTVWKELRK